MILTCSGMVSKLFLDDPIGSSIFEDRGGLALNLKNSPPVVLARLKNDCIKWSNHQWITESGRLDTDKMPLVNDTITKNSKLYHSLDVEMVEKVCTRNYTCAPCHVLQLTSGRGFKLSILDWVAWTCSTDILGYERTDDTVGIHGRHAGDGTTLRAVDRKDRFYTSTFELQSLEREKLWWGYSSRGDQFRWVGFPLGSLPEASGHRKRSENLQNYSGYTGKVWLDFSISLLEKVQWISEATVRSRLTRLRRYRRGSKLREDE